MGEVWRAFDLKLQVEVALKTALQLEHARDQQRVELLRREVRSAREVHSPNVCRIYDLIEIDGTELVSMEYVEGRTLLQVLQDRSPLDLEEALDIASQFLAGLEAIHRAGLVHRDVKPENIMITQAGRVVLMDFGLARQQQTGTGSVSGTPAYMAPEQAVGRQADARADVYSAGVVLAEMVSPDGVRSIESRQSLWEGVRSDPPQLARTPWTPVLKKAVAREPEERCDSAQALKTALEDVSLRQRDELRSFRVGEWLVEPSLNRLSRGDETVRLDLKSMDLLRCLAENAGEVVSTQELVDRVWQVEVVAVGTLTHAVAELRKALGDDARRPSYIETIPKRGYRLIAAVSFDVAEESQAAEAAESPRPDLAAKERDPYPGLAAFTEADAEFFFGREAEVAQLWRKLTGRRLLAVIGPSGVGKSSFVRAGVLPAAPEEWAAIHCQPGEAPLASLARALVPEFEGEREAMEDLVGLSDPDGAVVMISRWRERHDQALLVVDQFEELFTLCPLEVQRSFAGLLRRLVQEVGAHVLIVMRDDFMYRCHELAPLRPIFEDMTPLAQPPDAALRRALTEPAARLGYTFEGDLAHEMVAEVRKERGALPLLAFAVARLWEMRNREGRSLTRRAYEDIGGVGGALARHAEETLTVIGEERLPIAREIFRNLVTAEGTRAVREVDDLVSVFDESDREDARAVLDLLIDARLLTSFEEEGREGETRHHHVEVVHESLLTAWPRLVAWQTQDADSARLREDLRQAARMWHDHGRHPDRLWTGTAYGEVALWRDRYPGRLTELEQQFARAMAAHAGRRKTRRRIAVTAALSILLVVLAVVTTLWRRSVDQTRRAEAQKLVALGRNQLDDDATATLAWATASLEVFDTAEARRLAIEALWRGPPVSVLETGPDVGEILGFAFSPDGRFLAAPAVTSNEILVWSESGELFKTLGDRAGPPNSTPVIAFDSKGKIMLGITEASLRLWSIPDFELIRELGPDDGWVLDESTNFVFFKDNRLLEVIPQKGGHLLRWRPIDGGAPADIGWWDSEGVADWGVDHTGTHLLFTRGREVVRRPLDSLESAASDQVVARHPGNVSWFSLSSSGDRIAAIDDTGDTRIWSADPNPDKSLRVLRGPQKPFWFEPSGRRLVMGGEVRSRLWDIIGPPDAGPVVIRRPALASDIYGELFHPSGSWIVRSGTGRFRFWLLEGTLPHVLHGHTANVNALGFSGDGTRLFSASRVDSTVRLWPLSSESLETGRVVWERTAVSGFSTLAADRTGDRLLVTTTTTDSGVFLLTVAEGGSTAQRVWPELGSGPWPVGFSPDGRRAAAGAIATWTGDDMVIRVWDLETGEERALELRDRGVGQESGFWDLGVGTLRFTADGNLLSGGSSGVRLWNLETGDAQWLMRIPDGEWMWMDASGDGRLLLTANLPKAEDPLGFNPTLHDRTTGSSLALTTHGQQIKRLAIDSTGTIVVTVDADGVIRVGSADGSEPHLLMGHEGEVSAIAISPDGRWIATSGVDTTIRLWKMPDVSKPPLHVLPQRELLAKLKTLTNLRVVRDEESSTGWKLEVGPFPGWKTVPTW
jgi:WD40 repeat protein/DNA-binding winged helix-turn-helix (wHTH) protein